MSMTQLVVGSAAGFLIAQGVLAGTRHLLDWLQHDKAPAGVRKLLPSAFIGIFTKYAALVGTSAAVLTLGVWTIGDYLSAKAARNAAANILDSAAALPVPEAHGSVAEAAKSSAPASEGERPSAAPVHDIDPYADPDFRVRHPVRAHASLKEKLVEQSEAKARAELVKETQQHLRRSQYDCEAADRAGKYLKAGLDVWGFATWQVKYFPTDGYQGATLSQCREIKDLLDPSRLDLQSTVAQGNRP